MALAATYIEATAVSPLPFGLLDVADVTSADGHVGMGVEYEPDYCGPAFPTVAMCVAAEDVGSISISVSNTRVATITGTGEPANSTYHIDWGDGQSDGPVALDANTNTYAAAGSYTVVVTNPETGYYATVPITVLTSTAGGPFTANASNHKIDTDGIPVVVGEPFAVYHMQKCRTVASIGRAQARARRSLELGEGRAVEMVMQGRLADAATDITPGGTAVDIVEGLALLEGYAAANYPGVPTLHISRATVTRLASRASILRIGDHLETVQGSLVVSGAGYDGTEGPSAPAASAEWMFVTGRVRLWQGTVIESGPQVIQTSASVFTNEYRALAERPWVAAWECITGAVEVTAKACCP